MAKREMTEEQKAKQAENLAKARAVRKAKKEAEESVKETKKESEPENVVDKRDAEIAELKAQIAQMQKMLIQQNTQPQVIKIANDEKQVRFLWMAEVADDNVVMFGEGGMYGRIIGKTGTFYVPKSDLSRIMTSMNRLFLEKRWLIVLSGLEEEERISLGVNYKEGEILDVKAFERMLELGDEILDIFPDLCDGHKEMVARRFYEAWLGRSPYITRELIVSLTKISNCEAFKKILEGINAEELK